MSHPATILIVDDNENNIDVLMEFLESYEVLVSLSGEQALELLKSQTVDLVLLDVMMPHMDGYEVCTQLKNNPKTASIPVIFITAKHDPDSIEKAFDVGGSDYISKPFKPKELQARVRTQIELKRLIQELTVLATKDTMTHLWNRRSFFQKAQEALTQAKQHATPLCAMMLDLDHFKRINDTYGHDVGDEVIRTFAHTAQEILDTQEAVFGRIGGEEFALIVPMELHTCAALAEQIRTAVASIEHIKTLSIGFTVSIGIALWDNQEDVDTLLKRADEKLYSIKKGTRNAVAY